MVPINSASDFLHALRQRLPESVILTDAEPLKAASLDSLRVSRLPSVIVRPRDAQDISCVLVLANEHCFPVTVRGAGSATTGAATPVEGGCVLDLKHWDTIAIDAVAGMAHVGPGATIADINQAAEAQGWFYPPDPSSKNYATIGGSLATNAGGLRGAKYGVTRDYVLSLEGHLPTGEFVRWGLPLRKYASGFNLRDLWIGAEGMLGVITQASLRLLPKPQTRWTALATFRDHHAALLVVRELLSARLQPAILEFLDAQTVTCTERKAGQPFFASNPNSPALLMECDGHPAVVAESRDSALQILNAHAVAVRETSDADTAEQLWAIRRTCSQAMFQMGDTKLNEDVVVPVDAYTALIDLTLALRERYALATPTFGHVGDGNFHVHIMYDHQDAEQCRRAVAGIQELMTAVVAMGGAITGEHGIGLSKSSFLQLQHSPAEIETMQRIKMALDPNQVLNPDKIFTPTPVWELKRDRQHRLPWDKH